MNILINLDGFQKVFSVNTNIVLEMFCDWCREHSVKYDIISIKCDDCYIPIVVSNLVLEGLNKFYLFLKKEYSNVSID